MQKVSWLTLSLAALALASCSGTEETVSVSADAHEVHEKGVEAGTNKGPLAEAFEADVKAKGHDTVHFDFDKSHLRAEDMQLLDAQAAWLLANPEASITVEGYCDSRGPLDYNKGLGERRAMAVKAYLVKAGVDTARIHTYSFGNSVLRFEGDSPEIHQKNRASVTVVRKGDSN